jgi:hypothetical protein
MTNVIQQYHDNKPQRFLQVKKASGFTLVIAPPAKVSRLL